MATLAQKQTALKSWIRSVTGYAAGNVVLRDAGGPKPVGPYVVFDAPHTAKRCGPPFLALKMTTDGVVTRTYVVITEARVGIDSFGLAGSEALDKLELSASTYTNRGILAAGDLVFIRRTGTVYVPEYGDTEPVHRWRSDFYFYTEIQLDETDYELQKVTAEIAAVDDNDQTMSGEITAGEVVEEEEEE